MPPYDSRGHAVFDLENSIVNCDLEIIFSAHGCAGIEKSNTRTKNIAESIKNDKEIQFNFLLGDNIYPSGMQTALSISNDYILKKFYYDIYNPIISYCVLGNHDYNYWSAGTSSIASYGKNSERGTVLAERQIQTDPKKNWRMPSRYYLLKHELLKTVFFILDSNTFLWDKNQQNWLVEQYFNNNFGKYKNKILVMHHPLQSLGKREEEDHLKNYKPPKDDIFFDAYTNLFHINLEKPIGNQMYELFTRLQLEFHVLLCAHDHYLDIRTLKNGIIQCTSGSAGDDRAFFFDRKEGVDRPKEKRDSKNYVLNYHKTENKKFFRKNGYVKCEITQLTFTITFIEAETGKPLSVLDFKTQRIQMDDLNKILKNLNLLDQQESIKELQFLNQFLKYFIDMIENKPLNEALLNEILNLRDLLSNTSLAGPDHLKKGDLQTNIDGEVRSCKIVWYFLDVLVSAYFLKINSTKYDTLIKIPKKTEYQFISVLRNKKILSIGENSTYKQYIQATIATDKDAILNASLLEAQEKIEEQFSSIFKQTQYKKDCDDFRSYCYIFKTNIQTAKEINLK